MVLNTAAKLGSDDEESDDSDKEYGNRKHSALTRQGTSKRYNKALHGTLRSIDCSYLVDSCIKVSAILTIQVRRVEAATSAHSN